MKKGDRAKLIKPHLAPMALYPLEPGLIGTVHMVDSEPECEDYVSIRFDGRSVIHCVPISSLEKL